jgi:hypothetical protein
MSAERCRQPIELAGFQRKLAGKSVKSLDTLTLLSLVMSDRYPRPNFRTVAHMTAAKPQKTAGYRSRRRFVVLKIAALLKGFSS